MISTFEFLGLILDLSDADVPVKTQNRLFEMPEPRILKSPASLVKLWSSLFRHLASMIQLVSCARHNILRIIGCKCLGDPLKCRRLQDLGSDED